MPGTRASDRPASARGCRSKNHLETLPLETLLRIAKLTALLTLITCMEKYCLTPTPDHCFCAAGWGEHP
jgi:hypothetical protein